MSRKLDIANQVFGRLTAIERSKRENNTRSYWVCKCECGNTKEIALSHLRSGGSQSCGCLQKEKASQANTKHGGQGTSLYNRWKAINQRCDNPNNERYERYGGRGIKVYEEWQDFAVFKKWSEDNGYEEGLTIDREDNDKGYSPSNCRWVSYTKNGRNRDITVRLEGFTLGEIAETNKLTYETVKYRYYFLISKGFNPTINTLINYQYGNHEPS